MLFHNALVHLWHFIYQQVQLTNWFGNVVAGVAVFLTMDVCWQLFLKKWVKSGLRELHRLENDDIHAKLDHIILHHPDIPPMKENPVSVATIENPAGRVGPHRESHESRLLAHKFLADGVTPTEGFLEWSGVQPIGEKWGMAYNAQLGCCGFSMRQHRNMATAAANGEEFTNCYLTTWLPAFPGLEPAYWAYGIAQGEPGPHPDQGVDNASMFAWEYKLGINDGYGEIEDNVFDWFAQTFHGGCVGQGLDGTIASNDFNASPRIPWDTMAQTDGHDTLVIETHADGSGAMVTWGGVQPYTAGYRQTNWQDRWVVFDKEDPRVNWPALQAALDEVHGVRTAETIATAREGFFKDIESFLENAKNDLPALIKELEKIIERAATQEGTTVVVALLREVVRRYA